MISSLYLFWMVPWRNNPLWAPSVWNFWTSFPARAWHTTWNICSSWAAKNIQVVLQVALFSCTWSGCWSLRSGLGSNSSNFWLRSDRWRRDGGLPLEAWRVQQCVYGLCHCWDAGVSLASCVIVSVIVVDVSPSCKNHDLRIINPPHLKDATWAPTEFKESQNWGFRIFIPCTLAEDSVGHLHAPSLSHDLREGSLNLSSWIPIDQGTSIPYVLSAVKFPLALCWGARTCYFFDVNKTELHRAVDLPLGRLSSSCFFTRMTVMSHEGHGIQGFFSIAIWITALWQAEDVLRLAQFFTAPLLNSDAADRELEVWLELEVFRRPHIMSETSMSVFSITLVLLNFQRRFTVS